MRLIYPGSFDPPTRGHIRIAQRAAVLTQDVVVLVIANPAKHSRLDEESRANLLRRCLSGIKGVRVETGSGLLMEEVKRLNGDAILRGIRGESDYQAEKPVADGFKTLFGIETVFMQCEPELSFISSTMARQLIGLGGPVKQLVPEEICEDVISAYR